jgi:hypothetical protein
MLTYQIHLGLKVVWPVNRGCLLLLGTWPHTPLLFADPCKPDFYCGLYHLHDLDTDLHCRYSVYLTGHTDFDCGLSRFPDLDTPSLTTEWHTAGVTDRQGMLTAWHLILPLVSPRVRVCSIFWIFISYGIYMRLITVRYITFSFSWGKKMTGFFCPRR